MNVPRPHQGVFKGLATPVLCSSNNCRQPDITCTPFYQYAGVSKRDNVFYWNPDYIRSYWRTGNLMSAYWNARAMAFYAGSAFEAGSVKRFYQQSWLQYLPMHMPAPSCPDAVKYVRACFGCAWGRGPYDAFQYPHSCEGAWSTFRLDVQHGVQAAIMNWTINSGFEDTLQFQNQDVVIQFRCAHDTVVHEEYGPFAFSCYDVIPASTQSVYILVDPQHTSNAICSAILKGLENYLQTKWQSAVKRLELSTEASFIAMMQAPILFRHSQSSFGLWAGYAGNNTVYSAPMVEYLTSNTKPDFGPNWRWLSCPVLYPKVAKDAGISATTPRDVLKWLATH